MYSLVVLGRGYQFHQIFKFFNNSRLYCFYFYICCVYSYFIFFSSSFVDKYYAFYSYFPIKIVRSFSAGWLNLFKETSFLLC